MVRSVLAVSSSDFEIEGDGTFNFEGLHTLSISQLLNNRYSASPQVAFSKKTQVSYSCGKMKKKERSSRDRGSVGNQPQNWPRASDVAQDLERGLQRLNLGLTLGNALLVGNASIDALRLDLLVVEKRGLEFLCFFHV